MTIAIDPGPTESAWVLHQEDRALCFSKQLNRDVLHMLKNTAAATLVIEKVAGMGMAVGAEVFETVYWSGRFAEAFGPDRVVRITRAKVKMEICGSMRAKDANIRQSLIDRYGGPGAIKKGGPLYKVSGDCWSAIAVLWTYQNMAKTGRLEVECGDEAKSLGVL